MVLQENGCALALPVPVCYRGGVVSLDFSLPAAASPLPKKPCRHRLPFPHVSVPRMQEDFPGQPLVCSSLSSSSLGLGISTVILISLGLQKIHGRHAVLFLTPSFCLLSPGATTIPHPW